MASLEFYCWNLQKTSAMCTLSWTDASAKWVHGKLRTISVRIMRHNAAPYEKIIRARHRKEKIRQV
jgi:hypothetical protein